MSPEHCVFLGPRGYAGDICSPSPFSLSPPPFSSIFSQFSSDHYVFLFNCRRSTNNSPHPIVLVKLIACPPKVFVTFLKNNYSQGLTIWGTVSHSEDTGVEHTCGESLMGWLSLCEMTHSCSPCADKGGRRHLRTRRNLPLKLIVFLLSSISWWHGEEHLMPGIAVTTANKGVLAL